ncbi:hypothetical protein BKA61DRAFT_128196 [Leptodontidium sp. MPI-SDFR-AT-0119]|nr:hypothetical protein BKA61DRAFT_128196 [Leptodontidium sp. MPI-SDFR-AT-0119]
MIPFFLTGSSTLELNPLSYTFPRIVLGSNPSRDEIVSAPGTDEGPPESDSDKDPSEPDIDPYPTKYWKGVIEEYTARDITKHSDRLIALSGIADEYQSRFGYRYLAGIWENDLPYALSWYAYAGGALPDTYIAPSWSWASIVGPVEYPVFQYSDKFSPAEFSSQQCKVIESGTTAERRETGLITDGYLVVRGQTERAFLVIKDTDSYTKPYISLKEGGDPFGRGGLYLDAPLEECTSVIGSSSLESTPLKTFRRSSTEPMENSLSTEGCSSGNVLLLMIGWHRGNKHSLRTLFLVLVPSTRVAGAFERIGLLRSRMARPYSSPWEVVKIV